MTSQLITNESRQSNSVESKLVNSSEVTKSEDAYLKKVMQSYQAAQQVQYLHLQAEIEVLLQQLQTLKQQRSLKKFDRLSHHQEI